MTLGEIAQFLNISLLLLIPMTPKYFPLKLYLQIQSLLPEIVCETNSNERKITH
jgi:hypothetical protein